MGTFLGYSCSLCKAEYGAAYPAYVCEQDGGNLDVVLDFEAIQNQVDAEAIASDPERSLWRYSALLPVKAPDDPHTPLRSVGWTPMFRARKLAGVLDMRELWIKDDGRNPTASLKDRASAVVVQRARDIGAQVVVTASTGNAGAALAGMAAAAQLSAAVLAPKTAPEAKVAQLLIYGAQVFLVDGTYDDAIDLSLQAAEAFGWYCRNTGYNAFTLEGKKTAAFEICEQLDEADGDRWNAPDAVFVSVGDGNIISGLHKGFKDLLQLGWIDHMPRLFGVQSSGSAAIANAFAAGSEDIRPVKADTLADSISVDLPRDGVRAVRAASQTGGAYLMVQDESILQAMSTLAKEQGVFAEPAGATPYAGLLQARAEGLVDADLRVVVLVTGSGLKDVAAAKRATGMAQVIQPSLGSLQAVVSKAKESR